MKRRGSAYWCIAFAGILACSCSVEKQLPEGAYALKSNKVIVTSGDIKPGQLLPYIKQQGQATSLAIKKQRNLVVFNPALLKESEENICSHLQYLGYFGSTASSKVLTKKRKAFVTYTVTPGKRIPIRDIEFTVPQYGTVARDFYADTLNSLVKPGSFLSEEALEKESERFSSYMRTIGYYGFSKNHFFFEADTLKYPGEALLKVDLRDYTRNESKAVANKIVKYHIGNVDISHSETLKFNEKVLRGLNTVQRGALYNEQDVKITYNRLSALKVFNSVGVEMNPVSDSIVNCSILLTESRLQGFKIDLKISSNSSGLVGISPNLSYYNKNIFKGGEWLNLSFLGDFQFKFNDPTRSTEFGISAGVSLPRFLGLPYSKFKGSNIPRTEINTSFTFQDRPEYRRQIASLSYGYTGSSFGKLSYQAHPLKLNFVKLYNMDPEFIKSLEKDPFLKYAYQDHLDAGAGCTLYWASTLTVNPKFTFRYLRFNFDISGNILSAFNGLMPVNENGERLILGVPYAQYVKGELQLGHTWRFGANDNQALAARLLGGVGYAYGNSSALPFEKQFYCGGANSMRGWQTRSLGPGSSPMSKAFSIPSQTGDIKIEANVEYRYDLFWKLAGATFVDVGNVWKIDKPGADERGVFRIKDFYRTLGCDWGIGLRCDLNFIVIRLDYGMQVYNPVEGEGWIKPASWFKGYSAVHFGVGYPF